MDASWHTTQDAGEPFRLRQRIERTAAIVGWLPAVHGSACVLVVALQVLGIFCDPLLIPLAFLIYWVTDCLELYPEWARRRLFRLDPEERFALVHELLSHPNHDVRQFVRPLLRQLHCAGNEVVPSGAGDGIGSEAVPAGRTGGPVGAPGEDG